MDTSILQRLLTEATAIARRAGQAVREIAADVGEVLDKADGSPLTRADRASHEMIVSGLGRLVPAFPILSEEGDLDSFDAGSRRVYWCVDPLDGTKEFIRGLSDYTVNIALVDCGEPTLGVVDVPAAEVTYYAARGLGAFKVAPGARPVPIRPSRCEQPASAVVSRSHLSAETERFLERVGIASTVRRGSSVKICAVAEGSADIYPRFGPTCLWDTAAGAAVAREAGCAVVDLSGEALSYDPDAGLKHAGFLVVPAHLDMGRWL